MRPPSSPRELRCAVYTRKSSEEGLEQDFNSLHAQREACEAFITSQRHEGWRMIPTLYDDGGYSGGSMDRPGLTKLLADVASGLIDVVVVYKVDRLTRSLTDFARIVELFDAQGVSFVSVTQAFNTTSSMGRLTLNVLLSFAQFEREVTGERIRDKIAASKKKGLWMGGFVPIGYEANGRTLTIHEEDAETVRTIFRLYCELGSVDALKAELDRRGIVTKVRPGARGEMAGGKAFSRGHLYRMLQNPLYIGQIRHKGQLYEGQHPPIIEQELWTKVQDGLAARGREHRVRGKARQPSLLTDLLFDETGRRLTSTHAVKDGKRYRYYVSAARQGGRGTGAWRLPAQEIESLVLDQLRTHLSDLHWISTVLAPYTPTPDELRAAFGRAEDHRGGLQGPAAAVREGLLAVVGQVGVSEMEVHIAIRPEALLERASEGQTDRETGIVLVVPARLRRVANENRIVVQGLPRGRAVNPSLVKAIARGHVWFEELATGQSATIAQIAAREGVTDRYVSCLLKLAFLLPELVEAWLSGQDDMTISTKRLILDLDLPLLWPEQRQAIAAG